VVHYPISIDQFAAALWFLVDFCQPFNDRASQEMGTYFFGNNSLATIARKLFKPSTDAANLIGSIKKNC